MKIGDIIEVEWLDSYVEIGWEVGASKSRQVYKSVGYFLKRDGDYIYLAGDCESGCTNRRIQIPIKCIQKKRMLDVAD